jgi:sirohydrochlorin ferrochelatase
MIQTITALLIVAHGDGGEARLNGNVQHLAGQLARRLDLPVDWAVLKEPETFDEARKRLGEAAAGRVLVFPLFMSDGYFVRVKMPKILRDHGFANTDRLTPLGLLDPLIDLIEQRLRSLASLSGGLVPADLPTLMVAHGSRSGEPASRLRAETVAATLTARGLGTIHLAFIEEPPSVAEQLAAIDPKVVIGFFASEGTHALNDVKELVDQRPGVLHHVAAIGTDEGIAGLVVDQVATRFG